jgi:hypothetical protein
MSHTPNSGSTLTLLVPHTLSVPTRQEFDKVRKRKRATNAAAVDAIDEVRACVRALCVCECASVGDVDTCM